MSGLRAYVSAHGFWSALRAWSGMAVVLGPAAWVLVACPAGTRGLVARLVRRRLRLVWMALPPLRLLSLVGPLGLCLGRLLERHATWLSMLLGLLRLLVWLKLWLLLRLLPWLKLRLLVLLRRLLVLLGRLLLVLLRLRRLLVLLRWLVLLGLRLGAWLSHLSRRATLGMIPALTGRRGAGQAGQHDAG